MNRYTVDAVGMLAYLADVLPAEADRCLQRAEHGTAVVQAPDVTFAEVFYRLAGGVEVDGEAVTITPEQAWLSLGVAGPLSVASFGAADMTELLPLVGEQSIHDAMLVASHRAHGTDAIISTDPDLDDRGIATVWE
jgi:predicted nucleic acid-binding protein